jgi:hypothetical protein
MPGYTSHSTFLNVNLVRNEPASAGNNPRCAHRLQGPTDPGSRCPGNLSGDPGRPPPAISTDPPVARARRPFRGVPARRTLEGPIEMPSKPKPETTDEAREAARRALQTSMDTRQ